MDEPIDLVTDAELNALAACGGVVASVLDGLAERCVPGITPRQLDAMARAAIAASGAQPLLSEARRGDGAAFPGVLSVGVNDRFTHAIPSDHRLRSGDLVTLDLAARLTGWCTDASRIVAVGECSPRVSAVRDAAMRATAACIAALVPDGWWSDAARAAEAVARAEGFALLDDFAGHGIGRRLHQAPLAGFGWPNRSELPTGHRPGSDQDFRLSPGLVLTIEPVLTLGEPRTRDLPDGWTIATADGMPACFLEHTVAITASGPRVLTVRTAGSN